MSSIKVMLNYRPDPQGRRTLIFQLLHRRQRCVIFSPYRLLPEEFDPLKQRTRSTQGRTTARRKELRAVNRYIDAQFQELENSLHEFSAKQPQFTVAELAAYHRQRADRQSVEAFARSLIEQMENEGKFGTAGTYRSTMNMFGKFAQDHYYRFDELTPETLLRFEHFLKAGKLQLNTVTFYMRVLRAIYNKAVRAGYAPSEASPFRAISFREEKTRKLALKPEHLRRLAGWDFGRRTNLAEARDLFLFSFYTRGMSFVDMAYLKQSDISEGTILYRRHKTGQPLNIRILPELQALIDRYRSDPPWVLPILRAETPAGTPQDAQTLHQRYKAALNKYLFGLSTIARELKIPQRLTFNAARHSWASLARVRGIPVGVISESLGHTSEKTTAIYLDTLNPELVDRANEIVTRI